MISPVGSDHDNYLNLFKLAYNSTCRIRRKSIFGLSIIVLAEHNKLIIAWLLYGFLPRQNQS